MLAALGKRPDALAVERLTGSASELTGQWLTGHRVRELVVVRAHLLAPANWRHLIELAARVGARLWLVVHQPALPPDHRAVLETTLRADSCGSPTGSRSVSIPTVAVRPWRDVFDELPAPPAAPPPAFPPVPDVVFPLLRAHARRLLDAEDFAQLDAAYTDTFHAARAEARRWRRDRRAPDRYGRTMPTTHHDQLLAAAVLQRLTADLTSPAETRVRVAAAQAAFLREGVFLRLAPRPRRGPDATADVAVITPRLGPDTAARLRRLVDPTVATALTLTVLTGASTEALYLMQLADIHDTQHGAGRDPNGPDAGLIAVIGDARYRVPAAVAAVVRTHLARRRAQLLDRPPDVPDPAPDVAPAATRARRKLEAVLAGPPLLVDQRNLRLTPKQLRTLIDRAAARTGAAFGPPWLPPLQVTDLYEPAAQPHGNPPPVADLATDLAAVVPEPRPPSPAPLPVPQAPSGRPVPQAPSGRS